MNCDFVIVGGGSAGCVLANRLSASGEFDVVLIEAGRDQPPDRVEPAILDSYPRIAYFDPKNLWADLRVFLGPRGQPGGWEPTPKRYEQARIMGGGSSLNDMQANRGLPADYDGWHASGAEGWDWNGVLPYFIRLERDLDFAGPLHGQAGPIPVRRILSDVWPRFSTAMADAMRHAGFAELEDQNAEFVDGFFPIAISNAYDRRVSASMGYLDNSTRRRRNLRVFTNTSVREISFRGHRAAGVVGRGPDGDLHIEAKETILSAGAIHTPAMLLRAGIGPASALQRLGIEVRADRPGVGRNLQEHPALSISAHISPHARLQNSLRRHTHLGLRFSSGKPGCPDGDMYMVALSKTGWHPVGKQIGSLVTWVNKPYSRGSVSLVSASPDVEPHVEFAMLSDKRDLDRLKDGLRKAAALFRMPEMNGVTNDPFPASYSERVRSLGVVSNKNLILTSILARCLDGPSWLRRAMLRHVVTEGAPLDRMLADDEIFDHFVRTSVHGLWHPSCSCRMGRNDDEKAVVTSSGRVIGVEGLRIADASVMPSVPAGNTNIPTIMIAEKISDAILTETRGVIGCSAFGGEAVE
ncbi:GMC family oxidoreductase N-terminal domain-containing protein [Ensifer sp. ENS04]|nr:GMC family oxidoreductase N-terminal domain-containing protein [Ensifer sp. ENS04]